MDSFSRRSFLKKSTLAAAGLAVGGDLALAARPAAALASHDKSQLLDKFQGVYNFLTTPFLSNYELDGDGVRKNVAYHAKARTKRMVIMVGGGLGELYHMDSDTQGALAEAAVAGSQGRLPVVVGAGGGFGQALKMARNAERAGADAVMIFPGRYPIENADGHYEYFRRVAESVDIPALAYPQRKFEFWADVLARLAELPNMIGFKDGTGGITTGQDLSTLIPKRLLWVAEGEGHAMQAYPFGCRAYTTAVATFVPEASRVFWEAGVAGKMEEMKRIYDERIEPVMKVRSLREGYGASGIKVALEELGRAGGPVLPPGTQVLPEDRAKLGEIVRKYAEKPSYAN